jgi:TPR repeat protein
MRFSAVLASFLALIIVLAQTACTVATEPVDLFRSGEFESAFEIFSERAANNDMAAVNFLGIHYYLGAGVERDFERAVRYFERAAFGHNADAQRNLAIMYLRGLGVRQDNHRAYAWFYQSLTGGNANAREYLRMLADNVTPNAAGKAREWVATELREHARAQP